jgi:DNA uptake protein ComE-like DNA-binding protein
MSPALRLLPWALALAILVGTGPARGDSGQPSPFVMHGSTAFDSGRPLVDINSAPTDALTLLKGVGPGRAAAIIKGRPYESGLDLRNREIVPEAVYEAIKGRIIALPPR